MKTYLSESWLRGSISLLLMLFTEVIVLCASVQSQVTKDTPGWFEFVIPGLDATQTPVDMSFLNPEPAGSAGSVRIENGYFVDGAGKRLKFLGTNLTFSGAFPDKDVAPKMAAHLRKLGVNVVRFHHMDNSPSPRGIWLDDRKRFDPEQLDKLDWIIYQFKQHGIYSNINLHVSRNYPGLPDDLARTFQFGKVLDHFYRPFIEMQKEYARELLTHENPYTGTTYTQEPAVAFVEINNENTLVRDWGNLLDLPEPFKSALLEQWNSFLKKRFRNTDSLRDAWDVVREPPGEELLLNRDFADGTEHWILEQGTTAEGSMEVSEDGPKPGEKSLHVLTLKPGEQSWNLQLIQHNLTLVKGAAYTLKFWARSNEEREIGVGVRLQESPWRFLGLSRNARLMTEWREFSFVFLAEEAEPGLARVDFNFQNQMGHFWFADMSLRRGGFIGLPEDQSIEKGNVAIPAMYAPESVRKDFWAFLFATELDYSEEMTRFLKDELNVQAFVSGTQASYGGLAGVYREMELSDYIDMHSYWEHPRFPGRPWSGTDWNIPNTSMVRDRQGGTLTRLAMHRVPGMPFTVSEYDHPAPNDHTAEMFPMLASFAAFQDWDGLYQFDYGGGRDRQRISGFFAMNGHPGKLAFLPVAAVMFRMDGVSAGAAPVVLYVPNDFIVPQLALRKADLKSLWEGAGASAVLPVIMPVAVRLRDSGYSLSERVVEPSGKWVSNTMQIVWDITDPQTALYTVNAPAIRAAVGYLGGKGVTLGDVRIEMPTTETNWASIAIAALDGKSIDESERILLVAAGRVENTNMGWNEDRTSVSNRWGTEPTVAEGIPANIIFTTIDDLRVQSLDGTGMPKGEVPCHAWEDRGTTFTIGPEYKTLWYLITRP